MLLVLVIACGESSPIDSRNPGVAVDTTNSAGTTDAVPLSDSTPTAVDTSADFVVDWDPVRSRSTMTMAVRRRRRTGSQRLTLGQHLTRPQGPSCSAVIRGCPIRDIDRVSTNDLRRTFAAWLKQAGVDPSLDGREGLWAPLSGHLQGCDRQLTYDRQAKGCEVSATKLRHI